MPQWDNQKARTIFEAMLAKTSNKIDAVAAANDGLGNAVVTALKAKKLPAIPVSGQDATAQGVQNVISGWQSGTVYKPVQLEANAAANVAIALIKGTKVKTNGSTSNGQRGVPSVLLTPIWITKANYQRLFTDGYPEEVGRVHRLVRAVLQVTRHQRSEVPPRRHLQPPIDLRGSAT